jgi:hypothetical protein
MGSLKGWSPSKLNRKKKLRLKLAGKNMAKSNGASGNTGPVFPLLLNPAGMPTLDGVSCSEMMNSILKKAQVKGHYAKDKKTGKQHWVKAHERHTKYVAKPVENPENPTEAWSIFDTESTSPEIPITTYGRKEYSEKTAKQNAASKNYTITVNELSNHLREVFGDKIAGEQTLRWTLYHADPSSYLNYSPEIDGDLDKAEEAHRLRLENEFARTEYEVQSAKRAGRRPTKAQQHMEALVFAYSFLYGKPQDKDMVVVLDQALDKADKKKAAQERAIARVTKVKAKVGGELHDKYGIEYDEGYRVPKPKELEIIGEMFATIAKVHKVDGSTFRGRHLRVGIPGGAKIQRDALAHYIAGEVLIELRPTSPDSLPHEFFHFLQYEKLDGSKSKYDPETGKLISRTQNEQYMINTYRDFTDFLETTPECHRMMKLDKSEYWASPLEMGARMYEQWFVHKLETIAPESNLYKQMKPGTEFNPTKNRPLMDSNGFRLLSEAVRDITYSLPPAERAVEADRLYNQAFAMAQNFNFGVVSGKFAKQVVEVLQKNYGDENFDKYIEFLKKKHPEKVTPIDESTGYTSIFSPATCAKAFPILDKMFGYMDMKKSLMDLVLGIGNSKSLKKSTADEDSSRYHIGTPLATSRIAVPTNANKHKKVIQVKGHYVIDSKTGTRHWVKPHVIHVDRLDEEQSANHDHKHIETHGDVHGKKAEAGKEAHGYPSNLSDEDHKMWDERVKQAAKLGDRQAAEMEYHRRQHDLALRDNNKDSRERAIRQQHVFANNILNGDLGDIQGYKKNRVHQIKWNPNHAATEYSPAFWDTEAPSPHADMFPANTKRFGKNGAELPPMATGKGVADHILRRQQVEAPESLLDAPGCPVNVQANGQPYEIVHPKTGAKIYIGPMVAKDGKADADKWIDMITTAMVTKDENGQTVPDKDFILRAAHWYDELGGRFKAWAGGDEKKAMKLMKQFGLSQANASPAFGVISILRAQDAFLGKPQEASSLANEQIKQLELNDDIKMTNLDGEAVESNGSDDDSEGSEDRVDTKLSDFIDSIFQKTSRTVMGAGKQLGPDGQPVKDKDGGVIGGEPVCCDVWQGRFGGLWSNKYKAALTKSGMTAEEIDGLGLKTEKNTLESRQVYEWQVLWNQQVAKKLNEQKWMGQTDWTGPRVQAVGWVALQAGLGNPNGDMFMSNVRSVKASVSMKPGTTGAKFADRLQALPPAVQADVCKEITNKIVDRALEISGAQYIGESDVYMANGVAGALSPTVKLSALASPETLTDLVECLSYLAQDDARSVRLLKSGNVTSMDIVQHQGEHFKSADEAQRFIAKMLEYKESDELYPKSITKAVSDEVATAFLEDIDGKPALRIVRKKGNWNAKDFVLLNRAVEFASNDFEGMKTETTVAKADSFAVEHDWENDPDGEQYFQRLDERGRQTLEHDLRDSRDEVESWWESAISAAESKSK